MTVNSVAARLVIARKVFKPLPLGQGLTAAIALLQMLLFSRYMPVDDFAVFGFSTAVWTMGVAFVGSSIGTRIMRELVEATSEPAITRRELATCGASTLIALGISYSFTGNITVTALLGGSLLASIFAEIASYVSLGRNERWLYACTLVIRNLGAPMFGLGYLLYSGNISITSVLIGTICSNIVTAAVQFGAIPKIIPTTSVSASGFVGSINLILWIIASGDRVILGFTVDATQLAAYSLIYGLVDRAFRVANTTYVSSMLPSVLAGGHQRWAWPYRLCIGLLGVVIAVAAAPLVELISAGKYVIEPTLAVLLVASLVCFASSGPGYVDCVASDLIRYLVIPLVLVTSCSFIALWILAPVFGYSVAAVCKLICYATWFVLTSVGSYRAKGARNAQT